jgi:hypothetical protein
MAEERTYPSNLKLLLIGNSSVGECPCVWKRMNPLGRPQLTGQPSALMFRLVITGKSSLLLRFTDDDFLSVGNPHSVEAQFRDAQARD